MAIDPADQATIDRLKLTKDDVLAALKRNSDLEGALRTLIQQMAQYRQYVPDLAMLRADKTQREYFNNAIDVAQRVLNG